MLDEKVKTLGCPWMKSIFRKVDRFELFGGYVLCFCFNTMLDYSKSVSMDSYLLHNFLRQMYDYQLLIIFLLSFIIAFFHYQMICQKKVEVHCRILVGDTISSIVKHYCVDCLIILFVAFCISVFINSMAGISITHNFCLVAVFIGYISISLWKVKKYENI